MRKEFRDQRFLALLGLALVALDLAEMIFSNPDLDPITDLHDTALSGFLAIIAFAVGTGLLAREIDDGTLTFLDGLPVSRSAVFVAKLTTTWPVLMVYPVAHALLNINNHLLSRNSLNHALHLNLIDCAARASSASRRS